MGEIILIKKRYLFLIIFVFLFAISTVSAEEISNQTEDYTSIDNEISVVNETDILTENMDGKDNNQATAIETTIISNDTVGDYNNVRHSAIFLDKTGKALDNGTEVMFTIDDDNYLTNVDSSGLATIKINKNAGNYTITNINPVTGEKTTNKIIINQIATKLVLYSQVNWATEDYIVGAAVNARTGMIIFNINGKETCVNVTSRGITLTLDNLTESRVYVIATYIDPENNYKTSSSNATFSTKFPAMMIVKTEDIKEGEDAIFKININSHTTQEITLTIDIETIHIDDNGDIIINIDTREYKGNLTNKEATITVPDLPQGSHKYTVRYPGNNIYWPDSKTGKINVNPAKLIITVSNDTLYHGGSEILRGTVTDTLMNPVSDISLLAKFFKTENDTVSQRTTTKNDGSFSFKLDILDVGNYSIPIIFDGNEQYFPANVTSNVIIVETTINESNLIKIEKAPQPYSAVFFDKDYNLLLNGTMVTFKVNNVSYTRHVDENGAAKLNINLMPGKYDIITVNPVTGENKLCTITILPRIVNNTDVTKFYRNETQYYVTVLDDSGNPVGAGETVTFNINGVLYNRTTNESSIAMLNINLQPGDYIITAEYKNCRVSNNITVLPVLTAEDLTKKYGTKDQFAAILVDGQGKAYANQTVTFNINGVFYNRTTDSLGQAKLNINLMPGEYIITSSYNGTNVANKITVKS